MKSFVLYNTDGEITRSGSCPDSDFELQGTPIIEGFGNFRTHYVSDGVLTVYTDEQMVAKATHPLYPATWSNSSMSWVDTRSLDELKAAKWEEIKQARTAAVDANMTTPHGVIQCDPDSRKNITDAILLLQQTPAGTQIDWTMYDNTVVSLGLTEMLQIGLLLGQKTQTAFATARARRTTIDAATTVAEVEAITW